MNQKITVKRQDGAVFYCVLSGERSFADQLNEWHFGAANPRGGVAVYVEEHTIETTDYYVNERLACFEILSVEDTEMDIAPQWTPV